MWSFFTAADAAQRRAERLADAEEAFISQIRQERAARQGAVVILELKEKKNAERADTAKAGHA